MIRKYAGEMELVCDRCGEESASYDNDSFDEMISDVKAEGWVISRTNGHWNHECRSCASEGGALAAARRKFGLS